MIIFKRIQRGYYISEPPLYLIVQSVHKDWHLVGGANKASAHRTFALARAQAEKEVADDGS